MYQNLRKFVQPGIRLFLLVMVCFVAASVYLKHYRLAEVEGAIVLALLIYTMVSRRKKQRELADYIESLTYDVNNAKKDGMQNFPLPIAVFRLEDGRVIWGNSAFFRLCGGKGKGLDSSITQLVPEFNARWLLEGANRSPQLMELAGQKYLVQGSLVQGTDGEDTMAATYWVDVTEQEKLRKALVDSRPVVAVIVLDNYEELIKSVPDRMKVELRNLVEDRITQWVDGLHAIIRRYDRDRYVVIFEERDLPRLKSEKFHLLQLAHEVVNPMGIQATVSIGIGHHAEHLEECYDFATTAAETALARGGDQAVVKDRYKFEYFGGRGKEVESRTKVKSRVMADNLASLVKETGTVYVMGHKYGDLDCLGAAMGLVSICRKLGAPIHVIVDAQNCAAGRALKMLAEQPEYKGLFLSPAEAHAKVDARSLMIVVDTNRPEQVEDERLLHSCKLAVIDHHRRAESYIQNLSMTFHEPYASSASELVTELLEQLVELRDIHPKEAEVLLAGMTMDTKNFTLRAGARTFEAAAFLRRAGADPMEVKKLLQNDLESTVARYRILQSARIYRGIAVAVQAEPHDRVVAAQAADELLNITGVETSVVLCASPKGGCSVCARSIGNINVQLLLEPLGGGGNRSAAGVQFADMSTDQVETLLYAAMDKYLAEE